MNTYQLKKKLYKTSQKLFSKPTVASSVTWLAKKGVLKPTNKYVNLILNHVDFASNASAVHSLPVTGNMNVTNLCNYRCKFCEIHFFYPFAREVSGTVFPNNLTIEDLKKHDAWLRNIFSLELSGATGEPFINPHFLQIVKYLKETYPHIILTATSNGSLISRSHMDALIDAKFDRLLFSIHGGDEATYKLLQGSDFNKIISMVKAFAQRKKERGASSPVLAVNFALNKLNADSIYNLIDVLQGVDVEFIHVQHYYDTRNIMKVDRPIEEISYYYDVEIGNKLLDKIYAYAKEKGVGLYPKEPLYLDIPEDESVDTMYGRCREPWRSLKIKGCVEHENTVYLSVCNRMLLFKMDYKKFFAEGGTIKDIWNHALMQYLRKTVSKNPICAFCLNPKNRALRCLNNTAYGQSRDEAVKKFLEEFKKENPSIKDIPGLEVLEVNPYGLEQSAFVKV